MLLFKSVLESKSDELPDFFADAVNEAGRTTMTIKRKYTDAHPQETVGRYAPIRMSVLKFLGEKNGECESSEFLEYFNSLDKVLGKKASLTWLQKNTGPDRFVTKETNSAGDEIYVLTKKGKKAYGMYQKIMAENLNEPEMVRNQFSGYLSSIENLSEASKTYLREFFDGVLEISESEFRAVADSLNFYPTEKGVYSTIEFHGYINEGVLLVSPIGQGYWLGESMVNRIAEEHQHEFSITEFIEESLRSSIPDRDVSTVIENIF